MNFTGLLGLSTILALVFVALTAVAASRLSPRLRSLITAGLLLRVAGAFGYLLLVMQVYGKGDFLIYFDEGVAYAERVWQGDLRMFTDANEWHKQRWWGTQFVRTATGIVLTFIGPTMPGAFLTFSLLAFSGLVGFVIAFRRLYPAADLAGYARWVWIFPSLWFWPATIGKEALILFGLGLWVMGWAGRGGRIHWLPLSAGLALVFAVRPQVAGILLGAMVLGHWISLTTRWTLWRALQGAAILGVAVWGLSVAVQNLGMAGLEVEEVQGYLDEKRSIAIEGGSSVEAVNVGWTGVPLALVNILFRPFPWEAGNPLTLVAGLEVLAFWALVWRRRREVAASLRDWRSDRLKPTALAFILLYSIALGLVVVNMGIIVRQRIFVFPFAFLLVWSGIIPAGAEAEGYDDEAGDAAETELAAAEPSLAR